MEGFLARVIGYDNVVVEPLILLFREKTREKGRGSRVRGTDGFNLGGISVRSKSDQILVQSRANKV